MTVAEVYADLLTESSMAELQGKYYGSYVITTAKTNDKWTAEITATPLAGVKAPTLVMTVSDLSLGQSTTTIKK